jgi:hypothetical protein
MSTIDELVLRSKTLKQELVRFSEQPRFKREFRREFRDWTDAGGMPDDAAGVTNFVDRFVMQHRLHGGRTVVDMFVEAHPDLPQAERDFLLGWRDVRAGVFEIKARKRGVLDTVNLVDDLSYRIHSNAGTAAFGSMARGSFLQCRIVPVHEDWLFSGVGVTYTAKQKRRAYDDAIELAVQQPELTFHNPERLARAWEAQRTQHAAFVRHFGGDEIILGVDELDKLREFWETFSGQPGSVPPADTDWLDPAVETVGVIFDEQTGFGLYADYELVRDAFADPRLLRNKRYKQAAKAYLQDDSVDPVPLQRLAARHPGNADRVLRAVTGMPLITWRNYGETLLRRLKADWYATSHLPRTFVLGDRLAAHLRARH